MALKAGDKDSRKVTFGKRKGRRAKKSYNKHVSHKKYRGQGR